MDGSFEAKKSTDNWFPIRLVDSTDLYSPEPSKAFGDITCKYGFEAATSESTYSVTTNDWKEQGDGNYWLRIGASEFTSEGKYIVKIECSGCHDYNFVVEVRDKTIAELMDDVLTVDTVVDAIKAITDNLPNSGALNDLATLAARLTAARAGYLNKLNVSGTLAHSDAAATYKATGFSTHDAAAVVTALFAKTGITAGGTASFEDLVKAFYALARGKVSKSGDAYTFYDDDDTTALFTLTIAAASRTTA